jgi:phosphoribosylanthranilate isomerase
LTRVKICGITNSADAQAAIEAGADALGFLFVPGTPRCILDEPGLIAMLRSIPPFVSRVGVCMSAEQIPAEVLPHIDVIQYYDHSVPAAPAMEQRVLPAFRVRSEADVVQAASVVTAIGASGYLLDAYHESSMGGAGISFDWSLASQAMSLCSARLTLAGGLTPDNVARAVAQVHPYAVDVSTGVESKETPRRKDHEKMRAFLRAVRLGG